MRISDWSSDVCSSDLDEAHEESLQAVATVFRAIIVRVVFGFHRGQLADRDLEIGPRYGVRRLKADATFIWLPVLMDGADAAVLIEVELEMRHLTLLDPSVFVTRYPSGNHGCGCAAARRANPVPRRSVRRRRARARSRHRPAR